VIVARAGKSIRAIFSELGEEQFRSLESAAIGSCQDLIRSVVSLGGGAYASKTNRDLLRSIGKTVWLDCPLEICLRRISGDASRPKLGDYDQMSGLLAERLSSYAEADYVIGSGELLPAELAIEIASILKR
jgi:shikimate kinase